MIVYIYIHKRVKILILITLNLCPLCKSKVNVNNTGDKRFFISFQLLYLSIEVNNFVLLNFIIPSYTNTSHKYKSH